ncbi:MAG TPA: hypothetical protein VF624_05175 [Tepidisphaeraceae bacterium]
MRGVTPIFICAAVAAVSGCARPTGKGIADEDASFKIPAIKSAVKHKDRSAAPQLVDDLSSTDSAVRLYAIGALERLTGEVFGYRYFDDDAARAPAVARWRAWLAGQSK